MSYIKIGTAVCIGSIGIEYDFYRKSNKTVNINQVAFNVLVKSAVRGMLWPIHVPQLAYHLYYGSLIPIYTRPGNIFSHEYRARE